MRAVVLVVVGCVSIACDRDPEVPAVPDAACAVGAWCGNDCDASSDACWACGELRYDANCNCRPIASTCDRPDCTEAGPAASGEHCGTYWWCERACADGLQCLDQPDRPAATYLRTCQAP
jgi:hypothetical protein